MTPPPALDVLQVDDVVQLASLAGTALTSGQIESLRRGLARGVDGKWEHFRYGFVDRSVLEARALASLVLAEDQTVLWAASSAVTADSTFRRFDDLLTGHPGLKELVVTVRRANGVQGIEMRNGSRLRFIRRRSAADRGLSADLVIVADGLTFTSDHLGELLPSLAVAPDPQIWTGA